MTGAEILRGSGADFAAYRPEGASPSGTRPLLIWGHGWGHSHAALMPLARATQAIAASVVIDFPGFGTAPLPPGAWGTADYADAVAEWLPQLPAARKIWVGHSFGSRVGLRLAAQHPDLVDGLFLIATPGLPPRRSLPERAARAMRRWTFRGLRSLTPEGPARERLRQRFGSADYRNAGDLRPIFIKTVSENLGPVAQQVRCPAVLVYGEGDTETPPDIGVRLHELMPQSELAILRGLDHWTVLTEGQHQVTYQLSQFIEKLR
jgi:pimeloyl-ACP methyl ester carboxylesterase